MQALRTSFSVSSRRVIAARPSAAATFSTSVRYNKDPIESVKETAESVNKTAGQAILKGVIEPAEQASEAVKSAAGVASSKASASAEDLKGVAKNASYEAEKVKADAAQMANNAATEAKKATK